MDESRQPSSHDVSPKYEAIRAIDGFLDPDTEVRDRLGNLARAMLQHRKVPCRNMSNADAVALTVSPRQSGGNRRFYAAAYLRLLGSMPSEIHDLGRDQRVAVTKLFEGLPQVAKHLGVDKNAQGYERIRELEDAAPEADKQLREVLSPDQSLRTFRQARQRIMRLYKNALVAALVVPFLPEPLKRRSVAKVLDAISGYLTAESRERIMKYEEAQDRLEMVLEDCERHPTRYVQEFFQPFFVNILDQLESDFQSSPLNKAGVLGVRHLGKRYPFAVPGAKARLAFAVENIGAGVALDAEIRISTDSTVSIGAPTQFLDELGPNRSVEPVEFEATVSTPVDEAVVVLCTLSWSNGDGSADKREEIFELPPQRSDIPWRELEIAEPYSLEPVRQTKDLIGRSKQLRQIIAKLRSPSVGSFWIHGQRRVGKTSVVRTLEDMPEAEDLTMIYLETGKFIDPEVPQTVTSLGQKICSRLMQADSALSHLEPPDFDGALSPLDDFMHQAFQASPDLRIVIVLDEFDALPPELYRPGPMSHALFMTLRSLSGEDQLGFICVGGETMPEILSSQGQHLNKFRPLRIDYLERESQWSDFVELVRRPVSLWATINDDAVLRIYEVTSGNPFFTKFVCGVLMAQMVERRDAFVTATEAERAIRSAVEQAGSNQFQHFWDDGILFQSEARAERERVSRRRLLMVIGELLRAGLPVTEETVAERIARFNLGEDTAARLLGDFEKRKILVREGEELRFMVGLFGRWLVNEGINELALSLVEEDSLRRKLEVEEEQRVKSRELVELVDRWGTYRGKRISEDDVRAWLDQFEEIEHQRLMYELLEKVQFFSSAVIREKLREGHGIVLRELAARGVVRREIPDARRRTDNILISYFGGEGKRGPTYAKLYADENGIYHDRIVAPEGLRARITELDDVEGVVFVDDFIGTGRTAATTLRDVLRPLVDQVEERKIDVFVLSIAGFRNAATEVERKIGKDLFPVRVSIIVPLDEGDKCFSTQSTVFTDPTKRARAKQVARDKGAQLVKSNPLGFGNCQGLVVFQMTCPNNSLPILWASGQTDDWRPLFPRP